MEKNNPDTFSKLQDPDSLWNPLDVSGSEAALRNELLVARQLAAKDQTGLIELMALIARAQAVQKRLPEARATLEEAEKLLGDEQANLRVSANIRWLLERGRLYALEKTPSQARILLAQAWTLAINSGEDFFAVDIAQNMAIIEPKKQQREWVLKAIEIAESSPLPKAKRWLGGLYATLAWGLYELRQFEESLETFQKSLRHLKAQGTDREVFVAKWSTGKVLRALGKTEEALAIHKALYSELGIGGARDGRLYEEMAECLQTLNQVTEAQLYFELAYRELSNDEWVTDNQPLKLKRMKDLGKVK